MFSESNNGMEAPPFYRNSEDVSYYFKMTSHSYNLMKIKKQSLSSPGVFNENYKILLWWYSYWQGHCLEDSSLFHRHQAIIIFRTPVISQLSIPAVMFVRIFLILIFKGSVLMINNKWVPHQVTINDLDQVFIASRFFDRPLPYLSKEIQNISSFYITCKPD